MTGVIVIVSCTLCFCGGLYGLICHIRMRHAQLVHDMQQAEIEYWKGQWYFPDDNVQDGSHI